MGFTERINEADTTDYINNLSYHPIKKDSTMTPSKLYTIAIAMGTVNILA